MTKFVSDALELYAGRELWSLTRLASALPTDQRRLCLLKEMSKQYLGSPV